MDDCPQYGLINAPRNNYSEHHTKTYTTNFNLQNHPSFLMSYKSTYCAYVILFTQHGQFICNISPFIAPIKCWHRSSSDSTIAFLSVGLYMLLALPPSILHLLHDKDSAIPIYENAMAFIFVMIYHNFFDGFYFALVIVYSLCTPQMMIIVVY